MGTSAYAGCREEPPGLRDLRIFRSKTAGIAGPLTLRGSKPPGSQDLRFFRSETAGIPGPLAVRSLRTAGILGPLAMRGSEPSGFPGSPSAPPSTRRHGNSATRHPGSSAPIRPRDQGAPTSVGSSRFAREISDESLPFVKLLQKLNGTGCLYTNEAARRLNTG